MNDHTLKNSSKPSSTAIDPAIGEIAARTWADRFSKVHDCIAELSKPDSNRVAVVHQLRVASRRAVAGLEFFRELVDNSFRRQAVNQLKRLRSGLGDLRDLDILSAKIRPHASKGAKQFRGLIRQDYERARRKRDARVQDFVLNLPLDDANLTLPFRSSAEKLVNKPFRAWAFPQADKITRRFLKSLKQADTSAESLHRLRICGKKLRYTLELLQPMVPEVADAPAFRRLKKLQSILGKIQDGTVQSETFERMANHSDRPGIRRFVKEESRRQKQMHSALLVRLEKLRSKPQRKAFAKELESLLQHEFSA